MEKVILFDIWRLSGNIHTTITFIKFEKVITISLPKALFILNHILAGFIISHSVRFSRHCSERPEVDHTCSFLFKVMWSREWAKRSFKFITSVLCSFVIVWPQSHEPLAGCVKLRVAHAPGMPGTFFPPPWVFDPSIHHVLWCMSGTLTSSFVWSRWRGKRSWHSRSMRHPHFLRIWQEAHTMPIGDILQSINRHVWLEGFVCDYLAASTVFDSTYCHKFSQENVLCCFSAAN